MGWAIALHGGAGDIPVNLPPERRQPREDGLRRALEAGVSALNSQDASALDVVELVVRELENNPNFNAGKGSVLTNNSSVEMEACIMDGNTKNCGAVSGLSTVVNAISLARLVMEKTPHIYLGFDGAEAFAREQENKGLTNMRLAYITGTPHNLSRFTVLVRAIPWSGKSFSDSVTKFFTDYYASSYLSHQIVNLPGRKLVGVETIDPSHFITVENIERLNQAKDANRVQIDYTPPFQATNEKDTAVPEGDQIGTVGCVAVDRHGNLATATSTGGLVNKMVGRIGDTPIIGAGTYANNFCAVSATGKGEAIIRSTIARDVAALMEYKNLSLNEAASHVVKCAPEGTTGLVAVSAAGEVTMQFNTTGMFRACATEDGNTEVAIWPSL